MQIGDRKRRPSEAGKQLSDLGLSASVLGPERLRPAVKVEHMDDSACSSYLHPEHMIQRHITVFGQLKPVS